MKVRELSGILSGLDPDSEVRIMADATNPTEYAVRRVCSREDFTDADDTGARADCGDVFIVQGRRLARGGAGAWKAFSGNA